ncbi:hypothetical protein SADUNF_Sadunf09G0039000 [Salix dunnii]|uniref:glucan endo-1,3-beta-D-glucosidase n=1 Tax=Salix dunnii TaxID=1413687 RepID=A0A835JV88_9ROSI|nr:hypothetical protein SADUNF_Sadunf09G0039000 [Salix dunnii]
MTRNYEHQVSNEILVDVSNENIEALANAAIAAAWVRRNIKDYWPDVKFKYFAVDNEIKGSQIKVSVVIDTNLLGVFDPPSAGVFKESEKSCMEPGISFLSCSQCSQPVSHALFTEQNVIVHDGQYSYKNPFDALMGAIDSALEKQEGAV